MANSDVWKHISIAELVFFSILLIIAVFPTYKILRHGTRFWPFFIRYYLIISVRIVGSILLIIYCSDNGDNGGNVNLLIAVIVFSSISLGFILMLLVFMLRYIEIFQNPEYSSKDNIHFWDLIRPYKLVKKLLNADYKSPVLWGSITETIVFIAIILNSIAGGLDADVQLRVQKAASLIFASSMINLFYCAIIAHRDVQEYSTTARKLKTRLIQLVFLAFPAVTIRAVIGVVQSFAKRNEYGFNDYTIYEGKWEYFTFLILLQEMLASIIFTVATWVVYRAEREKGTLEK